MGFKEHHQGWVVEGRGVETATCPEKDKGSCTRSWGRRVDSGSALRADSREELWGGGRGKEGNVRDGKYPFWLK